MWLVLAALKRPYTVWVGSLLTMVLGLVGYVRTPTDILPAMKVPVVVVFASYRGMPAPDMEQSIVAPLERALTRCDHLEHIESRSLLGIGIIKVYFRATVDPDVASSQVISLVNGTMESMPPGMLMPSVLKFDASAIPVGNLIIHSPTRDDKELLDLADTVLREELGGIEGLASAPVFGGVFRQVQIFVRPRDLEALKLSPLEVARIVNNQSQIVPTGEIRIGDQTAYVSSNSMVTSPKDFEKIPLWNDGRKIVTLGDVADVVDGQRWRTNTVRVDGKRAVYMPLLRQTGASAVKVIDNVQDFLPTLHERGVIPDDVQVEIAFDQSQYVRDALGNLRYEAGAGAVLAALVVLLFLGSLRGTAIVAISIPLSLLAAFFGLYLTGHTLNIMTLGGLALILGRVVDDTIVDVENTVRHLNMGKSHWQAVTDSAREISLPVLLATITTVVVFAPVALMEGMGKYLFVPLAVSATLAMGASYIVSRTVSPALCVRILRPHHERERFPAWLFLAAAIVGIVGLLPWLAVQFRPSLLLHLPKSPLGSGIALGTLLGVAGAGIALVGMLHRVAPFVEWLFDRITTVYCRVLDGALRFRLITVALAGLALAPMVLLFPRLGQELFPEVDTSEFTLHVRLAGGPRVEKTEQTVGDIERIVREVVPPEDLELVLSNIGVSSRWSAIYTHNNGPHAAFVRVQLRSGYNGRHTPTMAYVDRLRERLEHKYPGDDFFFETGGMIRRILNNGAVAPIEVQVVGRDIVERRKLARELEQRIDQLPNIQDTYLPQGMDLPQLRIVVDRSKAALVGLTATDVVRNVIAALMSSSQIAPNFWIDPSSGNPYVIGVQYPEHEVVDIRTLEDIPIVSDRGGRVGATSTPPRTLKEIATIERTQGPVEAYHDRVHRVSQILVNVKGNDLARAANEIERVVAHPTLDRALANLPADKRDLADNDEFKEKLQQYLERRRSPLKRQILTQYGVDPDSLKAPRGIRVAVLGEVTNMRASFGEMIFNLVLAVLLVYLLMAAQFSSWLDPLIVIVAAPLGGIGVIGLLWLTGTSLNVQSSMGVLMMIGISVSNSVLLVDFANRQMGAGASAGEAIREAARVRLRPILMTTIATILGLLPLAVHLHPGDEMNLPLARAVVGGLTASTILTLFIVPVTYVIMKRKPVTAARHP